MMRLGFAVCRMLRISNAITASYAYSSSTALALTSEPSTSAPAFAAPFRRGPDPGATRLTETVHPLTVRYPFPLEYLKDREMIVYDIARRPTEVQSLPGALFNVPVRIDILHRVVTYLRAKWRQGTHKAKTRGEVSGGGRKPRPQKKTGQSRQGSIRSPLWRGGGTTFGPRPRSHAHKLPHNVRLLGMKCALSAKCNEGRLVLVESLSSVRGAPNLSAQSLVPLLTALMQGAGKRSGVSAPCATALLVDSDEFGQDGGRTLRSAASRVRGMEVMSVKELTVYHVLKFNVLVITTEALSLLRRQLANPAHRNRLPLKNAWWAKEVKEFDRAALELQMSERAVATKRSVP